jgi:hypothetical protein
MLIRGARAILVPILVAACAASPGGTPRPTAEVTASPAATAVGPSPSLTRPQPTLDPSIAPASPPEPTPGPAGPPSEPATTPPPKFELATLAVDGDTIPAALLGGCGALWLGDQVYGSDSCGPWGLPYDAEPVVVASGGRLTFAAPEGFLLSIDEIESDPVGATLHSWEVTIATVDHMQALPAIDQNFVRVDQGATSLGYGDRAVSSAWVMAPRAPGEYVVQLAASVNTGPWTSTWPLFFWRVSVR